MPASIPINSPPPGLTLADTAAKLVQARRVRASDALGHQDGVRSRQRAMDVRRARQSGRAEIDERGGHRGLLQSAEDDRGDGVLARPGGATSRHARRHVELAATCRRISSRATRRSFSTRPAIWRMCATRHSFRSAWRGWRGRTRPHTVVGGGNLYFFKQASAGGASGGLRFARWVTAPERAAEWSIRTGYIATSRPLMKRRR